MIFIYVLSTKSVSTFILFTYVTFSTASIAVAAAQEDALESPKNRLPKSDTQFNGEIPLRIQRRLNAIEGFLEAEFRLLKSRAEFGGQDSNIPIDRDDRLSEEVLNALGHQLGPPAPPLNYHEFPSQAFAGQLPPYPFPPFEVPSQFMPPFGAPIPIEYPESICDTNELLEIESADYWENEAGGGKAKIYEGAIKSGSATVSAGPNSGLGPGAHSVVFGFVSQVPVPAADYETTVWISSRAGPSVGWAEANAIPGAPAMIESLVNFDLVSQNESMSASTLTVLKFNNTSAGTVEHTVTEDVTLPRQTLKITLPVSEQDREILVFETAFTAAATSSGHSYLSVNVTWDALKVRLTGGCRLLWVPSFGYWGEGSRRRH